MDNPKLTDWQNRVVEERLALAVKICELSVFLRSDLDEKLPAEDVDLLERQYAAMGEYLRILDLRIDKFPPDD